MLRNWFIFRAGVWAHVRMLQTHLCSQSIPGVKCQDLLQKINSCVPQRNRFINSPKAKLILLTEKQAPESIETHLFDVHHH